MSKKWKIVLIVGGGMLALLTLASIGVILYILLNQNKLTDDTTDLTSSDNVQTTSAVGITPGTTQIQMPDVTSFVDETLYYCMYNSQPMIYVHSSSNDGYGTVMEEVHTKEPFTGNMDTLQRSDFGRCQVLLVAKAQESISIENFLLNSDQTKLYTTVVSDKTNTNTYPTTVNVYEFNLIDGTNRVLLTKETGTAMFGAGYGGSFFSAELLANKYLILATGQCYGCGAPMNRFVAVNVQTKASKLLGDQIGAFTINADQSKIQAKLLVKVGESTECLDDCSIYEPIGASQEYPVP